MKAIPEFPTDLDQLRSFLDADGATKLPGLMGVEIVEVGPSRSRTRMSIESKHLAPNGYLHAASVIALADSAAGYGCVASLPDGATGFTTIEFKANFLRTLLEGAMTAEATLVHGGRTTQIWDSVVTAEADSKVLALFRCTQLILYPR